MLQKEICHVTLAILLILPFSSHAHGTNTTNIRAERVFNHIDKNNDGIIGPREFKHAKNIYHRIDINNDGKITKREYLHAKKHKHHNHEKPH